MTQSYIVKKITTEAIHINKMSNKRKISEIHECIATNSLNTLAEVSSRMLASKTIEENKTLEKNKTLECFDDHVVNDNGTENKNEIMDMTLCADYYGTVKNDVDIQHEKDSKKMKHDDKDIIKINCMITMFRNELHVHNVHTRSIAIEVIKKFHRLIVETNEQSYAFSKMILLNDTVKEKNKINVNENLTVLDDNQRNFLVKHKQMANQAIIYIKEKFSEFLNRKKILSLFLNDDSDINEKIGSVMIAHYFIGYCIHENVKKIFEKNIDINCVNEDNVSLLHMILIGPTNVSSDDKYLTIKLLIDKGVNPNIPEKRHGMTILHMICNSHCMIDAENKIKIVELIMKNNGDPKMKMKKNDLTPIDCAKNMLKHDHKTYTKILDIMTTNM